MVATQPKKKIWMILKKNLTRFLEGEIFFTQSTVQWVDEFSLFSGGGEGCEVYGDTKQQNE